MALENAKLASLKDKLNKDASEAVQEPTEGDTQTETEKVAKKNKK